MININRLFSWLSIRTKLIVAFAGLSILPIIVVGIFAIWSTATNLTNTAEQNLNNDVQTLRRQAADFLGGVQTDLKFLSGSSQFRTFDMLTNEGRQVNDANMKLIGSELLDFARTKGSYYRLRLLNKSGIEIMRVQAKSGEMGNHAFEMLPKKTLSRTIEYYYLFLTDSLKPGQIAFSPAEVLNDTGDRIAIVSFVTPLYGGGKMDGILVADIYASKFFQIMQADSTHEYDKRVLLVSGDGHFLYDSRRKKEWNKLFMVAKSDIRRYFPDSITARLLSGTAGIMTKGLEQVVSYSPLFRISSGSEEQNIKSGFSIPLFVVETIPKDVLMRPVYSATFAFGGAIVGFLILSITLSLLATSQFTKPIAEMRKGAEIISSGNYHHRLQIETRDEIEKLADQFNKMAESLMTRDQEIQSHRASLERKVAERTRELFDEKSKLQTILDNVPSAILVLDRGLTIQTVSAAFSKVTGYQPEEVIGKNCKDFFCSAGFCKTCMSQFVVDSGKVEGHLDQVLNPDGTDRFIEHFAVPMEKDGKVDAILEIVSDVTHRKRLEQHLVKTEKLATMGELAAFIAHEFRNSLTSIKMILQLFGESQDLDTSKKESLTVALNSAYRMESTVSELLGFAKPTKMEFTVSPVNRVIQESVAFVKLRADKARVAIEKDLDIDVPDMSIDVLHLREALVNIILNAVQAIEGRNLSLTNEEKLARHESKISISTKMLRLGKTMRDFVYDELVEPTSDQESDLEEIILKKGTECVEIEISDTGPGIEKANLSKIFDPFFTTKANGTGLGLSMAKRVVNGHGGIISVESELDAGTKFRMILPLAYQVNDDGTA